jgi:hypothetical protein
VRTELARPHIRIRNGAAKGGRSRIVPLWWDAGTLEGLSAWKADRLPAGAEYEEPFLASLIPGRRVKTFSRHTLRKRFRTACKILGAARLEALTVHHGRHTFISHSLAGRRSLAEVRDADGNCNVSITSGYLHVAVEDETAVGSPVSVRVVGGLPNQSGSWFFAQRMTSISYGRLRDYSSSCCSTSFRGATLRHASIKTICAVSDLANAR